MTVGKPLVEDMARAIADAVCLEVCELPDRTSPDDWPEACLVTPDELHAIVLDRITAYSASRDENEGERP